MHSPIRLESENYEKKTYKAKKIANLVKTKDEIDKNILEKKI